MKVKVEWEPGSKSDARVVRIEGKDGQVVEVVEQMNGGFSFRAATDLDSVIAVRPMTQSTVVIEARSRRVDEWWKRSG